MDFGLVSN